MERSTGMLPGAFEAYVQACAAAKLAPEHVVQTVGHAALSAGYHEADGHFVNAAGEREAYCAATDLSVRHPRELTGAEVSQLLLALLHHGFCPFWRHEGVFMAGPHIHMIWVATAMKPQLRAQVHDFCHGRDGLVSHSPDSFWSHFVAQQAWDAAVAQIRSAFLAHNAAN